MFRTRHFIFVLGLLPGIVLAQADSMPPPELLAYPCMACHGPGGNSVSEELPSIAGGDYQDMRRTLLAFKEGRKQTTIMDRITQGYSDQEIDAIARYFSSLPATAGGNR